MRVEKYEAANMTEALSKVKHVLGSDAMIVATRQIKPNGIFGRTRIEVTAALDSAFEDTPSKRNMTKSNLVGAIKAYKQNDMPPSERTSQGSDDGVDIELPGYRIAGKGMAQSENSALHKQIDSLQRMIAALSSDGEKDFISLSLAESDVNEQFIKRLRADISESLSRMGTETEPLPSLNDQEHIATNVLKNVLESNKFSPGLQKKHVAFVGPTGVGKTTTIAKLAARSALIEHKKVGLITLDTYRVGAADQLREYAELMNVPLRVVWDRSGFENALLEFDDCDVVYIDTAGRNPGDMKQVPALRELFDGLDVDVYLTLSAATRKKELERKVSRYLPLRPAAFVFTKLDEASVLGALINARMHYDVPISYTTFGQRVPEDLSKLDAREIAASVFRESHRYLPKAAVEERGLSWQMLAGVHA